MGLHGQLIDLSSDSFPVLLIAIIANGICTVYSFLLSLLHSVGLTRFDPDDIDSGLHLGGPPRAGSRLAGLIVLAEQLNNNNAFAYTYFCRRGGGGGVNGDGEGGNDCMFCLCTLKDGDRVRKLDCRHVFHKDCFDGWLHHLNFNCPLCRSPLVSGERVCDPRRRVGADLIQWLSSH